MEYGIRRPVVGLATLIEKYELQNWVRRVFVFRDGDAGIFPTFLYEFGTYASLGAYFYHDDLFRPGHDLIIHGGFWTDDWLRLVLKDDLTVFRDDTGLVETRVLYVRRPDRPFHGIGPDTNQDAETFYRIDRFDARTSLAGHLGPLDEARLALGFRRTRFDDGKSPSISELFDPTDAEVVPGFGGYELVTTGLDVALDTRSPDLVRTSGTGVRLELFGTFNVDPSKPDLRFVRWGGEGALFLDITGHNNVLGFRAYTEFAEPLDDETIPFFELPSLGGDEKMRGFISGRFRGNSVFLVTAEYRYPVWALLDASVFVSGGNAFGSYLDGLRLDRLFLSWGLGLRSNMARDVSFDMLLAFGTNRIDSEDIELAHVHFVFGVSTGF
jgi:outer membrane protein assembly factor BamA